jgi:hypothetical protein
MIAINSAEQIAEHFDARVNRPSMGSGWRPRTEQRASVVLSTSLKTADFSLNYRISDPMRSFKVYCGVGLILAVAVVSQRYWAKWHGLILRWHPTIPDGKLSSVFQVSVLVWLVQILSAVAHW